MTPARIDPQTLYQSVIDTLRRIAPELSADDIKTAMPLREQVDLDSMDWLNFLVALHEKLGVDIPESDYAKLVTLDDLVAYLGANVANKPSAA